MIFFVKYFYSDDMEEIGEILRKYRKAAKLTQQNVADALGVNRVSVTQWENGDAKPAITRLAALASLYGVPTDALLANAPSGAVTSAPRFKNDVKQADVEPPSMYSMPKDVPVLGSAACNHTLGAFQLEARVIDYVRRPPGLFGSKDVYGLYMEGNSMEPKFLTGDLVFVHPGRPARIGDAVVVQFIKEDGDYPQAMIGVLYRRTADNVELQKYNPPAIIKIPAKTVQLIHRILTNNELYGI